LRRQDGVIIGRRLDAQKRRIQLTVTDSIDQFNPAEGLHRRLTLHQLAVFVATAREGSTRAAADRVARSQSAASSALAELETALGARLFDRVGRRLVLNENGRALLPRATALLDQAAEVQALFGGDHAAPLKVAASFTIGEYLLPSMVARWTRAHPSSPVHLRIGNTSDVIGAVAGFEVDVGFIEGAQTHPDLQVQPWLEDELIIVAAADHPLAAGTVTARQLQAETWVLREHGSGTRQATDAWLLRHLGAVRVGFELGSTEAIKRVVAEGAGLACLSRHALGSGGDDRRLTTLRTRLPPARRRLATVLHRDKHLGAVTSAFLQHCGAEARVGGSR
jgi:DNA-binding transcriptional LysR family regulator